MSLASANAFGLRRRLSLAAHLGPPPAGPHQQEAPVVKEFRLFVFKGMADELQYPAKDKHARGVHPEKVDEDADYKNQQGQNDDRNAQSVAEPVHRMGMAARVLCD